MEQLYVFLSPEVEALIAENGIDWERELAREGLDVQVKRTVDPAASKMQPTRDVVLLILASTVALGGLSVAMSNIIDALGRNKRPLVTEQVCEPILGPDGQPLLDANKQPILQWVDRARLLEPAQTVQGQAKLEGAFGVKEGIKLTFSTGEAKEESK